MLRKNTLLPVLEKKKDEENENVEDFFLKTDKSSSVKKIKKKTYYDFLELESFGVNKDNKVVNLGSFGIVSASAVGDIREGFSKGLMEAAKSNKNVVVLCADLAGSVKVDLFAEKYPDRFFETGIAEQNMMSMAAGMCLNNKVPFVTSYAVFNPGRNWDQLRVGICYSNSNVKIWGCHAGLTTGSDGATHQALEDIAITRCLPNLVILVPCDEKECELAVIAAAKYKGPVYIRASREKSLNILNQDYTFEIGKAQVLDKGDDVTIIACGLCVQFVIEARKKLLETGIDATVINLSTIKPLDEKTILKYARRTGAIVTVEEHQKTGGMGSAVCELLSQRFPVPIEIIGVNDTFGESGKGYDLLKKYNISTNEIIQKVKSVLKRK